MKINKNVKLNMLFKRGVILLSGLSLVFAFQNCSEYSENSESSFNQVDQSFNSFAKTSCSASNALAFPGAMGYGKNTKGGRGGRVVHVTNLKNDGTGSLRWALEDVKEPRIVVFDVEGRINLSSQIGIRSPYVTIAGQTAPGEGIIITGSRIQVLAKEVIIRGLKSRPGDDFPGDKGVNRDTISFGNGSGNAILDKNSLTWAVDETLTIWGSVKNVTFSNNIIAESLNDSIHIEEGDSVMAPHGKGILIGHKDGEPDSEGITIIRNLIASNQERNPFFKGVKKLEFHNNLITNRGEGSKTFHLSGTAGPVVGNFEANYFEDGKDTTHKSKKSIYIVKLLDGSHLYFNKNYIEGYLDSDEPAINDGNGRTQFIKNSRSFSTNTEVLSINQTKSYVIANAGAHGVNVAKDVVDRRILSQVANGTTRIIDSHRDVGGFGVYNFRGRKNVDSDGDGMPDAFETANASRGLNPNRADDKGDFDGDGYTNIEEYINGLLDGFDLAGCDASGSNEGPSLPPSEPSPEPTPAPSPAPNPDNSDSLTVEAESMDLDNFSISSLSAASGGKVVQANDNGIASLDFPLASGTYDVTISYFDENDGSSKMSLIVDRQNISTFTWNQNLGSALANAQTLTSKTIKGVKINNRDIVELSGVANGNEPLRTDSIRFVKVADAAPAPSEPSAPVSGDVVKVEAEDMDLDNFAISSSSSASGGKLINANDNGTASLDFSLSDGVYDVTIAYYDENDGVSKMSLVVGGKTVETFTWSKNLGSALANKDTLTSYTIKGVSINQRQIVKLVGVANGKEPLRTDSISFKQVESASVPTSTASNFKTIKIEAEKMSLSSGLKIVKTGVASGGAWVESNDSGVLSYRFTGPSGEYDLKLGYFDENDGTTKMSLIVDGKTKSSWSWGRNLGSSGANAKTATTRTFKGLTLRNGDVIKFSGQAPGGSEPMRTDYLEISASN